MRGTMRVIRKSGQRLMSGVVSGKASGVEDRKVGWSDRKETAPSKLG